MEPSRVRINYILEVFIMKKGLKIIVGIAAFSYCCVSTVCLSMDIYSRIKDAIINYGDGRFMDGINKGYSSGFQQGKLFANKRQWRERTNSNAPKKEN